MFNSLHQGEVNQACTLARQEECRTLFLHWLPTHCDARLLDWLLKMGNLHPEINPTSIQSTLFLTTYIRFLVTPKLLKRQFPYSTIPLYELGEKECRRKWKRVCYHTVRIPF